MSKAQLQKDIKATHYGYILSDGTMNLQHLLPKAYDIIMEYRLQGVKHGIGDLKTSILECFSFKGETSRDNAKAGMFWNEIYRDRAELKEYRHGDIALNPHNVWDAACNFFNSIAPPGYYFGSSEGDGACIGWFKYEEEAV